MSFSNPKGRSRRQGPFVRRKARGVSPIIATILLVAITVVLAAVLYVLVSGLTRTSTSTPYELGLAESNPSGPVTYSVITSMSPTSGLTTSAFGLKIVNPSGSSLPYGTIPAACKAYATPSASCTAPASGWYGVLVGSNGTAWAAYGASGWTGYATGTTTIALNGGMTLWIISASSYTGQDYVLSAFGTGTSSVSGSVIL